jgi:hypothetical protein
MKASDVIKALQEKIEQEGDLDVYYVSHYDWVMAIGEISTCQDEGWESEPSGPYIGIE